MNNKLCKLCLKPIKNPANSQKYHPECFLRHRFQYQQDWWEAKKITRETYFSLAKKLKEMEKKI